MRLNPTEWGRRTTAPRPPLYLLSEICERFGVRTRVMQGLLSTHRELAPHARMEVKNKSGVGWVGLYAIRDFKAWLEHHQLDLGKYR